jgi:hypothetical protein
MPWIRFTANYDWQPSPKVMVAYKAGTVHLVKGEVARAAIAAGKAEAAERPPKVKTCQPAI